MLYEVSLANGVTAANIQSVDKSSATLKVLSETAPVGRCTITQNTRNVRNVQNTSGHCSTTYEPVPSHSVYMTRVVNVQLNFKLHEARPECTADRNPLDP